MLSPTHIPYLSPFAMAYHYNTRSHAKRAKPNDVAEGAEDQDVCKPDMRGFTVALGVALLLFIASASATAVPNFDRYPLIRGTVTADLVGAMIVTIAGCLHLHTTEVGFLRSAFLSGAVIGGTLTVFVIYTRTDVSLIYAIFWINFFTALISTVGFLNTLP